MSETFDQNAQFEKDGEAKVRHYLETNRYNTVVADLAFAWLSRKRLLTPEKRQEFDQLGRDQVHNLLISGSKDPAWCLVAAEWLGEAERKAREAQEAHARVMDRWVMGTAVVAGATLLATLWLVFHS